MVCRLFGTKPLSEPMLVSYTPTNEYLWNFIQNKGIFIQENALKDVVRKMADILLSP